MAFYIGDMERPCRYCRGEITPERHGNSQHCRDEHYYAAKLDRSSRCYHSYKEKVERIRINEEILAFLYRCQQIGLQITFDSLVKANLDLNFATDEQKDEKQNIWRGIGKHYNLINPKTKVVTIVWKRP